MNHVSVFPCSGCGTCNYCADRAVMEGILPPCTHEAARKAGAQVSVVFPGTEVLPDEAAHDNTVGDRVERPEHRCDGCRHCAADEQLRWRKLCEYV